jgi:hypothetical protein
MADCLATEHRIETDGIYSLLWDGNELVDWMGGHRRYTLDGKKTPVIVGYSYGFDAAVASPSGEFVALVAQLHTAAVLLRGGQYMRQINRDHYHASTYPYPLTFARLSDGREVLIHCPGSYRQLDIEDIVTGERITSAMPRQPDDCFHSRLSVSPSGRWLMSAGWVWHPVNVVRLYDLNEAMRDPATLDESKVEPPGRWEMSSAVFIDDETLLVGTLDEFFGDEGNPAEDFPGKHAVAAWKIGAPNYARSIRLSHPPGTLMPIGADFVVTFFEHPRLYDLRTGALVKEWPEIRSGTQTCSITWDNLPPPIALDSAHARFAVANDKVIHVVEVDYATLSKEVRH